MTNTNARYERGSLDWRAKGFPAIEAAMSAGQVREAGWNLFDGRFMLPTMIIREAALEHDIALLAAFAERRGVSLAPHGKTTMSPQIWKRQIDAGAWAITVATAWQARVAASVGIGRILIANEVVDTAGVAWLGSMLDEAGTVVICQVDSVAAVERLAGLLGSRRRQMQVLIEVGLRGGRTGLRSLDEAEAVVRAVVGSEALLAAGATSFERIAAGDSDEAKSRAVSDLAGMVRAVGEMVARDAASNGADELILSGGGSIYSPLVAEELSRPLRSDLPVRVVIRAGCTVTHDHGGYDRSSPWGSHASGDGPRLKPALEVWAPVVSIPEPGLAIAGAGRRDLPYDLGLPTVLKVRPSDGPSRAATGITVTSLDDQHAYLAVGPGDEVSVGDTIGFGVAHPCSAFDRWRFIPVVDEAYDIIDVYETLF
ncbi:MAG: hypothetical protein ACC726_14595 [Chloroflexota bacterium]